MRIELPLRVTKCKHIIRMSNWHTSVITVLFSVHVLYEVAKVSQS